MKWLLLVLSLTMFVACSDDTEPPANDASPDVVVVTDAGSEVGVESGTDTAPVQEASASDGTVRDTSPIE